jgi:hypothetical protein
MSLSFADVILGVRALTLTALQDGDIGIVLVGEEDLEACPSWSVNDSCAPGCARSRRQISRETSCVNPRMS